MGDPEEAHGGLAVGLAELRAVGSAAGLHLVGVASAEPFDEARRLLEERRAAGLNGSMQFTYRNPARSTDPAATLPGARSIVVGARSYHRDPPPQPTGRGPVGAVARYVWADDQAQLLAGLGAIRAHLEALGYRACVVSDQNHLVDRPAAHRAGLGWFGKNANLLVPGHGSWFVLGSVLTDAVVVDGDAGVADRAARPVPGAAGMQTSGGVVSDSGPVPGAGAVVSDSDPLPGAGDVAADAGPVPDGCGTCARCLDACPTGAIVAPGVVDARRCLSWTLQATGTFPRDQRVALGDRMYGCDDCQEVCPPNRVELRRADRSVVPVPVGDPERAWVPLLELLAASDEELLARHGRWYVAERRPRYLRRNALVVLGNVGDGRDPAVRAAVRDALTHPDALPRAHAVWAARRLGLHDLLALVADDPDPDVAAELAAPEPPPRRRP